MDETQARANTEKNWMKHKKSKHKKRANTKKENWMKYRLEQKRKVDETHVG